MMKIGISLDNFDPVYIWWGLPILPRIGEIIVALECFLPPSMVQEFKVMNAVKYTECENQTLWDYLSSAEVFVEKIGWDKTMIGSPIAVLYLNSVGKCDSNDKEMKINKYGLTFDYKSDLAKHLKQSIDSLSIPTIGKNALINLYDCQNLEDVLSVMLLLQRKGLFYKVRNIGRKTIRGLEEELTDIGLLKKQKNHYNSDLCTYVDQTKFEKL